MATNLSLVARRHHGDDRRPALPCRERGGTQLRRRRHSALRASPRQSQATSEAKASHTATDINMTQAEPREGLTTADLEEAFVTTPTSTAPGPFG